MMLVPRRNFDLFDDIFDDSFFMPKNDNKMMRTDIIKQAMADACIVTISDNK